MEERGRERAMMLCLEIDEIVNNEPMKSQYTMGVCMIVGERDLTGIKLDYFICLINKKS